MNNSAQLAALSVVRPAVDAGIIELRSQLEAFWVNPAARLLAIDNAQNEAKRLAGAFEMVRFEGLSAYCKEIAAVLVEIAQQPRSATSVHRDGIDSALVALEQYLQDLAQGANNATMRLFSRYQDLQHMRGMEMSFEMDLFFPDLEVTLPKSVLQTAQCEHPQTQIKAARGQYQQGLVRYLRQLDIAQSLHSMQQAMLSVMTALPANQQRAYWWICAGFFDCLGADNLPEDVNVSRILGRIDQQMRALLADKAIEEQPEMHQMLYVIAGTNHLSSNLADEVARTYQLQSYLRQANDISPALLNKRLSVISEQTRSVQESWDSCIAGSKASCSNFIGQTGLIEQYCEKLDRDTLQVLARAIAKYAQFSSEAEHAQALSMDMAMALLLLDRGLVYYHQIDGKFQQQALVLAERMHEAVNSSAKLDRPITELIGLYCDQESSIVSILLSKEMLGNLQRVEQGLNNFFEDQMRRSELSQLIHDLRQIHGGLHILELRAAAELSDALQQAMERLAKSEKTIERSESRVIATAVSLLESYLMQMPHVGTEHDNALQASTAELSKFNHGSAADFDLTTATPPLLTNTDVADDTDFELVEIFLEEADEVLGIMRENLSLCHLNALHTAELITIRRAFHTLKGSGRMVGLNDLGEVAWCLERAMNNWLKHERSVTPELLNMIGLAIPKFLEWVTVIRRQGRARIDGDELSAFALQIEKSAEPIHDMEAGEAPLEKPDFVDVIELHDATEINRAFTTLSVTETPLTPEEPVVLVTESVEEVESVEAEALNQVQVGTISLSAALFKIGSEESKQHANMLQTQLSILQAASPTAHIEYDFMRAAHTLAGVNRAMGFTAIVNLAFALESWLQAHMEHPATLQNEQLTLLDAAIGKLASMVQEVSDKQLPVVDMTLADALNADKDKLHVILLNVTATPTEMAVEEGVAAEPAVVLPEVTPHRIAEIIIEPVTLVADIAPALTLNTATVSALIAPTHATEKVQIPTATPVAMPPATEYRSSNALLVSDDVDEQLLPVFIEEADDLIPQIGSNLRAWREAPNEPKYLQLLNRLLHTLKGSARMAGAMRLGQIAHEMEDAVLSANKRQHEAGYWDELDQEFDRITAFVEELRSGKPATPTTAIASLAPEQRNIEAERRILEVGAERALQSNMLRVRADVIDRLVNEASEISVARARMESELRAFKDGLMELTESVLRLRKQLREVEIQAEGQMQARVSLVQDHADDFDPLEFDRFTRLQELTRFMNESVHDVQTVQQALLKNLDETTSAMSAQARLNRELQQSLMNVRMVPFNSVTDRLYRIVRQTGKELNKRANLELLGTSVELDRSVLEKMTAPFEHLLRNAIAHGLETEQQRNALGKQPIGEIRLVVKQENNEVVFELSDDGAGLNFTALRAKAEKLALIPAGEQATEDQLSQLIFASGVSTASEVTEVAGRGIGMDIVRSEITALGGRIDVNSQAGKGTKFIIHLPLTLAVTQVLMVRCGETTYAIPSVMVEQVRQIKSGEMEDAYRNHQVEWQNKLYPLHYLPQLLATTQSAATNQARNSVLLLRSGEVRMALHIEELLGNQEAVVKNIGPQLARLAGIAGATVLGNGVVVLILNPLQIAQRSHHLQAPVAAVEVTRRLPLIMVVDDSLTVRKITTRMLTRAGYDVVTAKDGVDALEQLAEIKPDVMLLDVEMPRMDGFELTKQMRQGNYKEIPIIMITSRTADKHRDHAIQLGVNAYLGKPYQEDELLVRIAEFANKNKP